MRSLSVTRSHFIKSAAAISAIAILTLFPIKAFTEESPFGHKEILSHDMRGFAKWRGLLVRYQAQRLDPQSFCKGSGPCPITAWRKLITSLRGKPVAWQLTAVNNFFNRVAYHPDSEIWGKADYWATPYEFLTRGGDCEDYAAAKFLTLQLAGVSPEQMRLLILKDMKQGGVMHAVLEVAVKSGERYMLDNQLPAVTLSRTLPHYQPIFSLTTESWWAYRSPSEQMNESLPATGKK